MTKWDLVLEYKDGSTYKKVVNVIYHINRIKRKKIYMIFSINTEEEKKQLTKFNTLHNKILKGGSYVNILKAIYGNLQPISYLH